MYFAMDEIGVENAEKIRAMPSEADRWRFIYDTAEAFGFDGIHLTPSLYRTFELDLRNIPRYFERVRLTFHFGGMYSIRSGSDYSKLNADFYDCFQIAVGHKMQNISIHPPFIHNMGAKERESSLGYLCAFIEKWLEAANESGVSLSLESHVSGRFFQFDGLEEYVKFLDAYPDLGALIDFSHNYYDGYSEDDIIRLLSHRNIIGLHISDAMHGTSFDEAELRERTHLPISGGAINYRKLLAAFDNSGDQFGVLEIKAPNEGIAKSIVQLKRMQFLCHSE